VSCVRLFPQFGRKHAVQLLDYAIDLSEQTKDGKQEKRPILFHVFSNNGLYFYANVLQQVARSSQVAQLIAPIM
jgi:pyridoxine/pyridoxamine 5'-phosphate oxidase